MFRNRGSLPNIENNNRNNKNLQNNRGYSAPHYSNYWNGNIIIIRYDKNCIIAEMIATILVFIIAFGIYLFTYKTSFVDPIADIKKNFLNAQFFTIVLTIVSALIISLLTKSSKENLIKSLGIIVAISIILFFVLFSMKLHNDKKYNDDLFGQYYEQYERPNIKNDKEQKISVGLTGVKISSMKQSYIDENKTAYKNFSIKVMLYMILHVITIAVVIYIIYRLVNIESKNRKLAEDDAVLFDEEENIKV